MTFTVEIEQEDDGRWIAAVLELPGVLTYGQSPRKRRPRSRRWRSGSWRTVSNMCEAGPDLLSISFAAA